MEVGSQEKDIGMPDSLGYSPAHHHNQGSSSSSKLSGADRGAEARRESIILNPTQTLDHTHLCHQHQLNPQQPPQAPRQAQDSNPDPDPVPAVSATIANAPNSKIPPPPPPASATNGTTSIHYRECLKNHAASMGGHVVDGCGEFMPSGEDGTPEALKCAACDCHRSFHRREEEGASSSGATCLYTCNPSGNSNQRAAAIHHTHTQAPPQQHHKFSLAFSHGLSSSLSARPIPQVMMAFGGGTGAPAESSSEDLNIFQSNAVVHVMPQPASSEMKKRFRTKFTQQQKERMQEFAEKLGWKIQKQDEQEVQLFCSEVGVKRQVFKVWMHNNKQAMKKKQL